MHEMELDKIYELSVKMESIAKEANSPQFCEALEIIRGGAANLLGITDSRFSLNYSGFNESRARKKVLASGNLMGLGGYTAVKTEVLVLRERWAEAVKVAWKGRWSILGVIATKYEMTYRFYKLLALTQYIPQLSGVRRWVHYLDAVAQRWILWLWSRDNPKGFAVYDAIASADFAALERKPLDVVLKKFEKAIAAGRAHSVKMHALACQRAYLFAKKHDLSDLAKVYLDHAIHHYNKWGATALADHLIKKHDPAFKGPTARAANLVGHAAGADAMVSANLDLDTIFKVSQAITKEVRLEKMTERLLEMLLENAGASRGLLVLAEEGQSPYIQAEIDTSSGLRELKPRTLDTDVLPAQIIQYILKSQKIVIISDQGSSDEFALDPYFKSRSPKAVLAAPILQQGKVLGVIYLENSATAHAFSLERNRMVELLAAQVATAIENSRLYRNLENTVAERTAEIQLILTNIEQGILSISGRSLKAHGEYSGHLGKILGHDDIADKTIEELLLNRAKLSITQKHAVLDCLRVAMGESVTVFLFNNHHLPKELLYKHRKESKVLEVDWTPIESGAGLVERILISLRDVTSLRSMEKEIAGKQRKIDLITQTLDLSGKQFSEYADQATQTCQECLDLIEEHSEANIRKIFIALHTQKGLAASLHLSFLVDEIHQAEGFYADAPTHGEAWSKEQARAGIEGIQRIIEEYRSVMHERLEGASATLQHKLESVERILADHFLDGRTRRTPQELAYALGVAILPGLQHLLAEQVKETQNVARHLHKNAPEIVFDKDICLFPLATSQLMRKVFVHLLRNSIDHGIESPAERAQAGKPASGRITIACELMSDILQITYRDDGRGVHLPSLRRAAMDGGFIDSASELSQAAIAELLFLPGFSTKNQLSRISGRGVGMSAVRDILCDAGCGITVHLGEEMQGYRSISFTLTVPCRMVVILHVDTKIAA